jgi:hypothetical protein
VIVWPGEKESFTLVQKVVGVSDNYEREKAALGVIREQIVERGYPMDIPIIMVTDSLGLVSEVGTNFWSQKNKTDKNNEASWALKGLKLAWTPAHIGFRWNDMADLVADPDTQLSHEPIREKTVLDFNAESSPELAEYLSLKEYKNENTSQTKLRSLIQDVAEKQNKKAASDRSGIGLSLLTASETLMERVIGPHMEWSLKRGKINAEVANIMLVLIYKRGDPHLPANFRPVGVAESYISLTDNYINELLSTFIMPRDLFSESIKGIQKKENGLRDSIFLTINSLKEAHYRKKEICMAIMDMVKYYDNVEHGVFEFLLAKMGVPLS